MSLKRFFTIFGLFCFALTVRLLFLAPPALAQGPVVNTAIDKDDGECVADCSLREAISTAAGGETITFAGDITLTLTSPLVISKNLIIDGSDYTVTISGNDTVPAFTIVNNAQAAFDTLTVIHGRANPGCSGVGGGLPSTSLCGGGIKVESGAALTLTHSAVLSSTAEVGGGILNQGTLIIAHSIISGNTAAFWGGGIFTAGPLTVQNSVIAGNSSQFGGGLTNNYSGPMTVLSSTIANNLSEGVGGGIVNEGPLTIAGSTISGNTAMLYGGGIEVKSVGLTAITNTTISGNQAGQNGGGIGTYINSLSIIDINHSTIVSNTAGYDSSGNGQGGGLFAFMTTVFTLTNTIVANRDTGSQTPDCAIVSPRDGGGIYSGGYNLIGDTTGCAMVTQSTDLLNQNAWLEPLADNDGPTQTHALRFNSPAVDIIPAASCALSTDQRGVTRPLGTACDIGAYETLNYRSRFPIIFRN